MARNSPTSRRSTTCAKPFGLDDSSVYVAKVEFETDGDGSSYPDRRWGIMALAVPIDFKPTGSELAKWRFCSDGPLDDGVGLIHKEPKLDSVPRLMISMAYLVDF